MKHNIYPLYETQHIYNIVWNTSLTYLHHCIKHNILTFHETKYLYNVLNTTYFFCMKKPQHNNNGQLRIFDRKMWLYEKVMLILIILQVLCIFCIWPSYTEAFVFFLDVFQLFCSHSLCWRGGTWILQSVAWKLSVFLLK